MSLDSSFNITLDSNDASFKILGNEKLRITSLGNVGIGTTSPKQGLHTTGRVQAGEMVLGNLPRLGGSWAGLYHTRVHDDTYNVGYHTNAYILSTGENGSVSLNCTTAGSGTSAIYFQANGSNKMTVLSSGNVGIGTTGPTSLLHVNGTITASTVNANFSGSVNASNLSCSGGVDFKRNYNGYFVKLGIDGGYLSPPTGRLYFINNSDNNNNITVYADGFDTSSDDRLKTNEVLITNATNTIMKLSPQIYEKYGNVEHTKGSWTESGLIAQDVWYNTPELRHIVSLPIDASGNESVPLPLPEGVNTQQNIQQDIDYVSLGWSSNDTASLNYIQLIPYLIKSNQEQQELINSQNSEINILKTQLADVLQRLTNANI